MLSGQVQPGTWDPDPGTIAPGVQADVVFEGLKFRGLAFMGNIEALILTYTILGLEHRVARRP